MGMLLHRHTIEREAVKTASPSKDDSSAEPVKADNKKPAEKRGKKGK